MRPQRRKRLNLRAYRRELLQKRLLAPLSAGLSCSAAAKIIGVHPSTIYRHLHRDPVYARQILEHVEATVNKANEFVDAKLKAALERAHAFDSIG